MRFSFGGSVSQGNVSANNVFAVSPEDKFIFGLLQTNPTDPNTPDPNAELNLTISAGTISFTYTSKFDPGSSTVIFIPLLLGVNITGDGADVSYSAVVSGTDGNYGFELATLKN
jgi:hypothetical protein